MTVKCLNDHEKQVIGLSFQIGAQSVTELAVAYGHSRRTIIRALEEQGIDPGIKRRKRMPKPTPLPVFVPKLPWWKRIFSNMKFTYTGRGEGPTA